MKKFKLLILLTFINMNMALNRCVISTICCETEKCAGSALAGTGVKLLIKGRNLDDRLLGVLFVATGAFYFFHGDLNTKNPKLCSIK